MAADRTKLHQVWIERFLSQHTLPAEAVMEDTPHRSNRIVPQRHGEHRVFSLCVSVVNIQGGCALHYVAVRIGSLSWPPNNVLR